MCHFRILKKALFPIVAQLLQKFPAFYGTQQFISLQYPYLILSTFCTFKINFSIILPSTPLFPMWFVTLEFCVENSDCFSSIPCLLHDLPIFVIFVVSTTVPRPLLLHLNRRNERNMFHYVLHLHLPVYETCFIVFIYRYSYMKNISLCASNRYRYMKHLFGYLFNPQINRT
jgi:hypothetical protein